MSLSTCLCFVQYSISFNILFGNIFSAFCKDHVDMILLAENITKIINNPSGESLDFIENIQSYYEHLEKIMDGIKSNGTKDWSEFFKIRQNGGPDHLKLYPVSPKYLAPYYNWDHFTIWQFRGLMKYTWVLWQDMLDYVNEL